MEKWKEYCKALKKEAIVVGDVKRALANRANARFRLAASFKAIKAADYSKKTLDGYSSAFGVFLAYTALELVVKLTDLSMWNIEINNKELSKKLRTVFSGIHDDITEYFNITDFQEKLHDFMNEQNNDLCIAANAIRIMVAHGSFTPHGGKALTKANQSAYNELKNEVLEKADDVFTCWFKKRMKENSR